MSYPCPIDFCAAWHDCTACDPNHRADAAKDIDFWQKHAASYDQNSQKPGYFDRTLAAISVLVRPNDTLLDVGAGAGRFALPLSSRVCKVTALDHAKPMLDILRAKLGHASIANIEIVEAAWEDVDIMSALSTSRTSKHQLSPHDVVLAAWSLYRLPNILSGIQKLIAATRRTLVIVAGAGNSLRHDPLRRAIWPNSDQPSTPLHIYFYGVLWQAGIHADLQILNEIQSVEGNSAIEIAAKLAPANALPHEIQQLSHALSSRLTSCDQGYRYEKLTPVGLLVWQRHCGTYQVG